MSDVTQPIEVAIYQLQEPKPVQSKPRCVIHNFFGFKCGKCGVTKRTLAVEELERRYGPIKS